ncbi:MAG: hypothetical protein JWL99_3583 [Streptomyces oryziradicis]|nr:hypothetical protein [Actinacidiphila oryziradicis]
MGCRIPLTLRIFHCSQPSRRTPVEGVVEAGRQSLVRLGDALVVLDLDDAVQHGGGPDGRLARVDFRHLPQPEGALLVGGQHQHAVLVRGHIVVGEAQEARGERRREPERVVGRGVGHPELHDIGLGEPGAGQWITGAYAVGERIAAERGLRRVDQPQPPALERAEVDEDVGPLGRGEGQAPGGQCERLAEQAAVGADQITGAGELLIVLAEQVQTVDAGVGGVEHPEAVPARTYLQVRPDDTVDQGVGTEEGQGAGGLVEQLPGEAATVVGDEIAVADHQRYLGVARGQPEPVLLLVPQQVHPGEPGHHVVAGDVHRVVVVPERHRRLVVEVVGKLRLAEEHGVLGPAVAAAAGHRSVQMDDVPGGQRGHSRCDRGGADPGVVHGERRIAGGVVQVGGDHGVGAGDAVGPRNAEPPAPAHLDDGSREVALVRPQRRRGELRVQPDRGGAAAHGQRSVLRAGLGVPPAGDPQRIGELLEGCRQGCRQGACRLGQVGGHSVSSTGVVRVVGRSLSAAHSGSGAAARAAPSTHTPGQPKWA